MSSEKSNAHKDHPTLVCMPYYFDLEYLLRSSDKVLGKGGFGTTYTAKLHGYYLVVKRLSEDTTYVGDERYLRALRSLKHPNLVSLQAYHISKEEKVFLYNYLPGGSVYSLLHTRPKPRKWGRRMRIAVDVERRMDIEVDVHRRMEIAVDVALGLSFLHKNGMVHGNVKSSNVLLDNSRNACLADSCLASHVKISSVAKKSSGYMAPEQYNSRKMCKESDVYSFGVLLFELATGKNPSSFSTDLPTWILSNEEEGLDVRLVGMLRIAMRCCSPHVYTRPTMSNVVEMVVNLEDNYN